MIASFINHNIRTCFVRSARNTHTHTCIHNECFQIDVTELNSLYLFKLFPIGNSLMIQIAIELSTNFKHDAHSIDLYLMFFFLRSFLYPCQCFEVRWRGLLRYQIVSFFFFFKESNLLTWACQRNWMFASCVNLNWKFMNYMYVD